MKRILVFFVLSFISISFAEAAVRASTTVVNRESSTTPRTSSTQVNPTTASRAATLRTNITNTVNRSNTTTARAAATNQINVSRSATNRTNVINSTSARTATNASVVRSAARQAVAPSSNSARTARAATNNVVNLPTAFNNNYNTCRDAYFTCMDQFCATQNETYRRCVCSSRLSEIQEKERALNLTEDQLKSFKDLNIEVITKTSEEVKAMLNATEGESVAATAKDTSESAQVLSGISEVINKTKQNALSTQGTLDIAGDINAIWANTDLTSAANIANLTGEALYNAVHSQCAELVASSCGSTATLNMVVSAYGMYIENDCTLLSTALEQQKNSANTSIRQTEREMNLARLENYNAHNSTSINDCVAKVRTDLTSETACGPNYVHCLDVTGKYLNKDTGEPIYTANFYQLGNQISLDGDILTNPTNRLIVNELNNKKMFAEKSLDTCRDLSAEVWDEFMRQAIVEIYQNQQNRIRDVKTECLQVVNECYDEKTAQLKDFSNTNEQMLIGSQLELAEQMCAEKLNTCSNLYGNGQGDGLELLLIAMHNLTDQKISQGCKAGLESYVKEICAVPAGDTIHLYPYSCRVYAPGDQRYANISQCNTTKINNVSNISSIASNWMCIATREYISCKTNYYLAKCTTDNKCYPFENSNVKELNTPQICLPCPAGASCEGGIAAPTGENYDQSGELICGPDYIGSMYQKLVIYALENCMRPSEPATVLPTTILEDVNKVMDSIRTDMAKSLSTECERLGGIWVDVPWDDNFTTTKGHKLHAAFYNETSANKNWGYCADPDSTVIK